uniref:Uncharacterized protein n=1 Tax=Nelumbo nucifera TaxID=4432 RepID=A0A822XS83_NELNU|nr:TPA_asm: hypothetical protein HUJ06_023474 [Nelumbo nucifera]
MNSDRNIVELKKNSVQISCFPIVEGRFIPHKLRCQLSSPQRPTSSRVVRQRTDKYLGYLNLNGSGDQNGKLESTFSNELPSSWSNPSRLIPHCTRRDCRAVSSACFSTEEMFRESETRCSSVACRW